ncbi:MAG: hypothetical protein BMS9Abin05_2037 [Rhodothermia bacterium]|nr:MAG: hypothetical protein BMS9Abin05_2037 [Rhodothermia bacterium]
MIYTILNEDPIPIDEVRFDVPENLASVVSKCLAKNRDERYSSMTELLVALADLKDESSSDRVESVSDTVRISKRSATIGAVGTIVLLLAIFLAQNQNSNSGPETSENTVAIFPFSVRGSAELDYLGEGMVDLMSEKLDGAGDLETVNPRVVIALIKNENIDLSDPEEGARAASMVGAGRYITGDVLQVGERIQLTAYINEISNPGDPLDSNSIETVEDELLEAIDNLASDILSSTLTGADARIQRIGTASTSSLPAAKEYLRGEKALREGRYRDAAAAYYSAVELDSTFALAYYRKSIAAEWIDAPDVRSSADKAMELADRLSPRDQALLSALKTRRNGWSDRAELAYRNHLALYLDDIEALVQLGEILFHENPRKGRPSFDSKVPFGRVLELEPDNLIAQIHVARMEGLNGEIDALGKKAEYFHEKVANSERALEADALIAYATNDSDMKEQVIQKLRENPFYYTFYVVHGVIRYARDTHGASKILENRVSNDPLLLWFIPQLSVMKGQFGAFREYMNTERPQDNPSWDLSEAFILTSGAVPANVSRLETLLSRLESADPLETRNTGFILPHDDITLEFIEFENAYHRAIILVNLDRLDEARVVLEQMRPQEAFPGLGSMRDDVIAGLEAEIAYRAGDLESALSHLREIVYDIPQASSVRSMADGARSRYLRAELELSTGDPEIAKGFLIGLDESWSPFDSYYRGPVYLRLAEIAEAESRIDDAILNYERLLEMRKDSDQELEPTRRSAEKRLAKLLSRRDSEPREIPTPSL